MACSSSVTSASLGEQPPHLQSWQDRTRWSGNERIGSIGPADYSKAMKRDEIVVNRQYQRSEPVWPRVARSYLNGNGPQGVPHFQAVVGPSLYQVTDLKSRQAIKEIFECILLNISHLPALPANSCRKRLRSSGRNNPPVLGHP
jgi:hypothetical protein